MIEQVNGAEVIEVHPAREAGPHEREDVVWSGIESGGVELMGYQRVCDRLYQMAYLREVKSRQ